MYTILILYIVYYIILFYALNPVIQRTKIQPRECFCRQAVQPFRNRWDEAGFTLYSAVEKVISQTEDAKESDSERHAEAIRRLWTITTKDVYFDQVPSLEKQISSYSWGETVDVLKLFMENMFMPAYSLRQNLLIASTFRPALWIWLFGIFRLRIYFFHRGSIE